MEILIVMLAEVHQIVKIDLLILFKDFNYTIAKEIASFEERIGERKFYTFRSYFSSTERFAIETGLRVEVL